MPIMKIDWSTKQLRSIYAPNFTSHKKKPTTQVKQYQYGSFSEDLFLPTIRRQTTTPDHLKNEDYL